MPRGVSKDWLSCVTRPGRLALLRLCAAVAACQSYAPGTIFECIAAYLVPCGRHSLGRVQSYTPSLLPWQNTTYARSASQKTCGFYFFVLYRKVWFTLVYLGFLSSILLDGALHKSCLSLVEKLGNIGFYFVFF